MSDKKHIDSENLLQWIGERITCEALCGNHIKSDKGCDGNCTLGEITPREKSIISVITESIKTAPAADVEPVVRCKDCKWYKTGVCDFLGTVTLDDDYCSIGARTERSGSGE